ncbi:hypothetical protein WJX74_009120 [Apatococcus lobatus]|uniref:Uncharacterized protein n=1 Tax=Apatococcus lobatus TaxID=904363 RepID=A0AAW1PY84_9CHLO
MTELTSMLRRQQPDSCRQNQTDLGDAAQPTLRLTGLRESQDETAEDLAGKVQEIMAVLPKDINIADARRMGRPGGKRARAVLVTFASVQDRTNNLRTKAELNKHAGTERISINAELSQEEQAHKNALRGTRPSVTNAESSGRAATSMLMVCPSQALCRLTLLGTCSLQQHLVKYQAKASTPSFPLATCPSNPQ